MMASFKPLPRHTGPHILPDFPAFHRLLYLARTLHTKIAIQDVSAGIQATHARYLSDILHLRNTLLTRLGPDIQEKLLRGDEVFICLLAKGGYEFAVGLFAIVALGAIAVPISATATVKEAAYFVHTAAASAILTTTSCIPTGRALCSALPPPFFDLPISHVLHTDHPTFPITEILISSDHALPLEQPGLVIFTSGTTGPPKGAVKKRSYYTNNSETFSHWWGFSEGDTILHVLPVHHSTGLSVTFLAPIISGSTVEFGVPGKGFDPAAMWARWLRGGLTIFSGVPTMYQRMMRYYEEEVAGKKPEEEVRKYKEAAGRFRLLLCGTSALPFSLQRKWEDMLGGGRRILERYGGTEFSGVFSVQPGDEANPDGSVGKVLPGVEVKLSEGEEGEILSRSPHMFTRYLQKPKATEESFTPDGWYLSGDIARREGEYYFILGRASIDIIKSGGYKLSALDIEREILGLDYVAEAIVVGVPDEEYGQKVAAAIVPRRGEGQSLTIKKLRDDLRARLSAYKMPQLLRLVGDFPRTPTGKVVKKRVREECFPGEGHQDVQVYKRAKL